jgi:hypothetical protein
MGDRLGRKRILVIGWLVGLPVPLLLIFAPSWGWVVFANVLLGANQGLCWSTTVIMKVDLDGPQQRGLATLIGLVLSVLLVRETKLHSSREAHITHLNSSPSTSAKIENRRPSSKSSFWRAGRIMRCSLRVKQRW